MTPQIAVSIATFGVSLAIMLSSIEQLARRQHLEPFLEPGMGRAASPAIAAPSTLLSLGKALAALGCLAELVLGLLPGPFLAILTALALVAYWRRPVGGDGADQLQLIILSYVSLCYLLSPERAAHWAALFISAQMIVSYCTTGWAKLLSSTWRKGDVLAQIFATHTYGHAGAAGFLYRRPILHRLASWTPIAIFSLFVVAFFQPYDWVFFTFMAAAVAFHVGTAVFMGLNNFMLTFPAAAPCLVYTYQLVHAGPT